MAQNAFGGARLVQAMPAPAARRQNRRPQHSFHLEHRAFQLQPFLIAPVLPGETMKNLLMQARVVTDPIKNPLIGWWLEHYIFYVKHRDLDQREELVDMMLNPAWTDDNVDAGAANIPLYTYSNAIDWVKMCLDRVVDCYFRDDSEDHTLAAGILDGLPMAHAAGPGWLDSLTLNANMTAEDVLITNTGQANDDVYASEIAAAMRQWELLRAGNLTQQSYEEYLATYGVKVPREELHIPELIRYSREWQYPSNTVNPANGTPSSAVSWSVAERADKDRFFREPGFIFGVTCARPKVYINTQAGAAAGMLNSVYAWLPAVLSDDPQTSFRQFTDAAGGGPLQGYMSTGYWVDVKDLYLLGDQFVNFALTPGTPDGTRNLVTIPTAGNERRYVADADIDALFVDAANAQRIRQDGVCNLQIMSPLTQTSPGVMS